MISFMVYQFETSNSTPLTTAPNYEVDFDGKIITVTHFKSGALISDFSLPHLETNCKGPFEDLAQYILREVCGAKGKDATSDLAAHANCTAVVRFTDKAIAKLTVIADRNRNMTPLYKDGKF